MAREARRKAAFLVATNVLDPTLLSDQELIQAYKEQGSVERGFAFLKDPLFLASSVFVKKPQRIVALVRFLPPPGPPQYEIAGVEPLHEQVIRLLGPCCEKLYELAV